VIGNQTRDLLIMANPDMATTGEDFEPGVGDFLGKPAGGLGSAKAIFFS
jgi:hypothetical protein